MGGTPRTPRQPNGRRAARFARWFAASSWRDGAGGAKEGANPSSSGVRYTAEMRRFARTLGGVLIVVGVLALAWVVLVWRWQDPVTALYTHWKQHQLAQSVDRQFAAYRPVPLKRDDLAAERRTFMPGQNRLVYIAGHRTTYLAPFSHIDAIRRGDAIRIEMPYATFLYRAVGHRIVAATDLSVLRSPRHEQLELQACHPRFFATHRYIVYARLATVLPRGGAPYRIAAAAQQ